MENRCKRYKCKHFLASVESGWGIAVKCLIWKDAPQYFDFGDCCILWNESLKKKKIKKKEYKHERTK